MILVKRIWRTQKLLSNRYKWSYRHRTWVGWFMFGFIPLVIYQTEGRYNNDREI